MKNYYFTFGSDSRFPYGRNDYVVVQADNLTLAVEAFKHVHPNRIGSGNLNCADFYHEDVFLRFKDKYYKDREPVEIIRANIEIVKPATYLPKEDGQHD